MSPPLEDSPLHSAFPALPCRRSTPVQHSDVPDEMSDGLLAKLTNSMSTVSECALMSYSDPSRPSWAQARFAHDRSPSAEQTDPDRPGTPACKLRRRRFGRVAVAALLASLVMTTVYPALVPLHAGVALAPGLATRRPNPCTADSPLAAWGPPVVHQPPIASGGGVDAYRVDALDDSFVRQATTPNQMIHARIRT